MVTIQIIFVILVAVAELSLSEAGNLAPTGTAAQSSLFENGVPKRAIDGNQNSNWIEASCTHTQNDLKPWWRVSLPKIHKIELVVITNRRDCCDRRLDGAEIRIGNSLKDNGNSNPRCAVISAIPPGGTKVYKCFGMEGQHVNILIPGKLQYLTLCEVEVYGTEYFSYFNGKNLATFSEVAQSSLFEDAVPVRAIDGNSASNWPQSSCTHTAHEYKPWWRADLLKVCKVQYVIITNRGDCCGERLNGVEIRVGNSLGDNGNINSRCAVSTSIPAGASKVFDCNSMEGQYVNVVIPDRKEYLTLCEVEIYGV